MCFLAVLHQKEKLYWHSQFTIRIQFYFKCKKKQKKEYNLKNDARTPGEKEVGTDPTILFFITCGARPKTARGPGAREPSSI